MKLAALIVVALVGTSVPKLATLYDHTATTIDGKPKPLSAYRGQVALVVNTASKCGFTPQYEGLQKLYTRYKSRGFVVLGFPANDFLSQEPGSNGEIAAFCDREYGVTFPMFEKSVVKGPGQSKLFGWLTATAPERGEVRWNFEKFLIDRHGKVEARWRSSTKPDDAAVLAAIEAELARK